jgi:membrane protein
MSLAAAWAIDSFLGWIAGPTTAAIGDAVLRISGTALEFAVNLVLSAALLTVVPRIRLSARRLLPTALVVAVGIQVLNSFGRWYINQLDNRPAYQLVTGAVGLLVYLYLLNQLILLGCALAATAQRGSMVDLSGAPPAAGTPAVFTPAVSTPGVSTPAVSTPATGPAAGRALGSASGPASSSASDFASGPPSDFASAPSSDFASGPASSFASGSASGSASGPASARAWGGDDSGADDTVLEDSGEPRESGPAKPR